MFAPVLDAKSSAWFLKRLRNLRRAAGDRHGFAAGIERALTFEPDLVWLLDGCHVQHESIGPRLKSAALVGFWFGFGYFLAGLYWIAEAFLVEPWRHGWLLPFVMTVLPGGPPEMKRELIGWFIYSAFGGTGEDLQRIIDSGEGSPQGVHGMQGTHRQRTSPPSAGTIICVASGAI